MLLTNLFLVLELLWPMLDTHMAEAEADPEAFYGHYGYPYGLGYNLGYAGYGYAGYPFAYGGIAATNAALGHAVAYTAGGVTHSSNVGVCTNYLGAVVPC